MSNHILFKKYQVLKILSKSKDSTVYLVLHLKLQCYYVIKQIYKSSPCYLQLVGEARIMKLLKHSCIPQIFDLEEDEKSFFIVEQYMEGESLKSICQKQKFQEKTILSYAIQVCDLIHYLHTREEKILYLDLKPENILVNGEQLYLVDFGSSSEWEQERLYGYGTPWFAAPEQYIAQKVDERADIYGIGMILYFMILGKEYTKVKGKNIDFTTSCSKELKRVVNRCLKIQAWSRYNSIYDLQKHLSEISTKYKKTNTKKRITMIAIAGAQKRIGVTHIAFQMASYIKHCRHSCLYLQCNDSNALSAMARRQGLISYREEGYILHQIPCNNYEEYLEISNESDYEFIIVDYGVLTDKNHIDFQHADHSLLIMGAKEWELDSSEESLKLCNMKENIVYLFNFLNALDFQVVLKNMQNRKCYRVPFEPQLKINGQKSIAFDFYQELWKELQCIINTTGEINARQINIM